MPTSLQTHEISLQEKKRKTTLAKIIYQVSIVTLIPMAAIAFIQGNLLLASADITCLCFMLAFLWFLRKPHLADTTILVSSLFFFLFCLYLFISGGVENTAYVWYYVFPLVNCFLLGATPGALLSLALVAVTLLYTFSPLPASHNLAVYSPNLLYRFFPSMLVVIFFAFLAEKSRESSQKKLLSSAEELYQEKLKADQATQAKSAFLANMSHEIRNPMAAIIGMNTLVLKTELTKRQRKLLQVVKQSSDNLLALLNDILDFSKIEAGQLSIENRPFSLFVLIETVAAAQELPAKEKGLEFIVENNLSSHAQQFLGDELRIKQVLLNIINNAIKFTDTGKIVFSIDETPAVLEQDQHLIRFCITDTGIGIPLEKQDMIFNSFSQSDNSTARQYGGTGLGLAICDQLARLMNGKIYLESEPDAGSSFFFEIPLSPVQQDHTQEVAEAPANRVHNLRILLAEDSPVNQEMAVAVLADAGHEVKTSADGLECLNLLCDNDVDLILMDVQMPLMDGLAATRCIRDAERGELCSADIPRQLKEKLNQRLFGKQIPVIALTANAITGDKEQCQAAGMNEYLTKPFNVEQIYETIYRVTNPTRIV